MTVKAIVHPVEGGGFWAEVLAMPGRFTQGESLEEVRANLQEAIVSWLEAGDPVQQMAGEDRIMELALWNKSQKATCECGRKTWLEPQPYQRQPSYLHQQRPQRTPRHPDPR